MGQKLGLEGSYLKMLLQKSNFKLDFTLITTCLFPSTFFQLVKNQVLAQIGGTVEYIFKIIRVQFAFSWDFSG